MHEVGQPNIFKMLTFANMKFHCLMISKHYKTDNVTKA